MKDFSRALLTLNGFAKECIKKSVNQRISIIWQVLTTLTFTSPGSDFTHIIQTVRIENYKVFLILTVYKYTLHCYITGLDMPYLN